MKEIYIFLSIIAACALIALPIAKFVDAHTVSKGERIERLEHRVNDLEVAVACLEQSFGWENPTCRERS